MVGTATWRTASAGAWLWGGTRRHWHWQRQTEAQAHSCGTTWCRCVGEGGRCVLGGGGGRTHRGQRRGRECVCVVVCFGGVCFVAPLPTVQLCPSPRRRLNPAAASVSPDTLRQTRTYAWSSAAVSFDCLAGQTALFCGKQTPALSPWQSNTHVSCPLSPPPTHPHLPSPSHQAYLESLTSAGRWSDAASNLPRLLKDSGPAWERWLFTFAQVCLGVCGCLCACVCGDRQTG